MATYEQLRRSVSSFNVRTIPNLLPVRSLIDEMRPQSGSLGFFDALGSIVSLDSTPVKLTQFTNANIKNTEIVPDFGVTDGILVNNPDGLGVDLHITIEMNVANNRTITVELYADDVATGIFANFQGSNAGVNTLDFTFVAEIPNGVSISLYFYATGAASNVTIFLIDFGMTKIPLYVDSKVTSVASRSVAPMQITNSDGDPVTNSDGDLITT